MTIEERATCDLCEASETFDKSVAPPEWASLKIVNFQGIYKEYAICPMCMPPVEGRKQDHADAGHPDPEHAAAEAEARGDPAREPSDARSGT